MELAHKQELSDGTLTVHAGGNNSTSTGKPLSLPMLPKIAQETCRLLNSPPRAVLCPAYALTSISQPRRPAIRSPSQFPLPLGSYPTPRPHGKGIAESPITVDGGESDVEVAKPEKEAKVVYGKEAF